MKSIIYKSFILLAVGSFLSCKKDAVQHTCAINSFTLSSTPYTYTYDSQGRVTSVISPSSTNAISYGSNNTVTINTTTNGTTQTATGVLNSNGCLVILNSSTGTFQMTYDNNNRLLSLYNNIIGTGTETVTYTYNMYGDVITINYSTSGGTSIIYNITDWDTNANVGQLEPFLMPVLSTYKMYGKFSNHLPKTFTYNNGSSNSLSYAVNSNGYVESISNGATTNYTYSLTCN